MRKWSRTAGLLFLAASSVYSGPAAGAIPAAPAGSAGRADAAPASPASLPGNTSESVVPTPRTEPTTDPFASPATNPADKPTNDKPASDKSASDKPASDKPASDKPASDNVHNDKAAADKAHGDKADDRSADAVVQSAGGAGPKVTLSDAGTFSIQINNDVSLVEVLRMIGSQAQVSIIPSKDVRGTVPAMDLYNVTVHEALDAILRVNGFTYKEKGNFIYVYSAKELAELEKQDRVLGSEVFRLYYTPAANAVNMIKPLLSADAQVSFTTPAVSGLVSGVKDSGGDSHSTQDMIVVTDYGDNLEKVRRVLKEIDRRPQQILIEATILRASLSENNALGIDFTILGSVNFADLAGIGHTPNDALTGSILNDPASAGVISKGYNGASTGFAQNVPQGGLQIGIVQNNIALFLRALEQVTDTTVLANPKVLALDKQRGEVIVGRQDGYLTTTVTSNAQTQTVEFLETGTRLVFRPYIGDDGYIRMEVHPEDSSGGLTSANLPFKITTEVTSNIMVKDGHTVLIGGLFRESSQSSKSQVPFLGNLPLAGPLFRQQADATTREEIIILLTPHIVKDDNAFSAESEKALKEIERLRVGVRQGMMPFGRERLAETCYEGAEAELHKPHPDLNTVRWHLDCATNLNPLFREAIELKEKVTGEELTTSDNSSVRGFIRREILAERAKSATLPAAGSSGGHAAEPRNEASPNDELRNENVRPPAVVPIDARPHGRGLHDAVPHTADVPLERIEMPSEPTTHPATQPAVAQQPLTRPAVLQTRGDHDADAVVDAPEPAPARATTRPNAVESPKAVTGVPVESPEAAGGGE